jgi:hypothetical protein
MFTIHSIPNGTTLGDAEDFSSQHSTTARREATRLAKEREVTVAVVRADKVAYLVTPLGKCIPPGGVVTVDREQCKLPRSCFCTPCREGRKAA